MSLTEQEKVLSANRQRVWDVRKYCQVKPSLAQYARHGEAPVERQFGQKSRDQHDPDPALAALLRGVLDQLSVDVVMISLLDDHTQYFISGATKSGYDHAEVTFESCKWYGCDQLSHHGGLCEHTITLQQIPGEPPTVYEVTDMSSNERTKGLPFVDGTIAHFRHYAGVPIASPEGHNIGTVFTMSEEPSPSGLSTLQRQYLYETSEQVMKQLVQAMQALEGRRAAKYNAAVASLLNGQAYEEIEQLRHRQTGASHLEMAESVYNITARLLHDFSDLAGLVFQNVPLSRERPRSSPDGNSNRILASSLQPGMAAIIPVKLEVVDKLLEILPQGGVLYLDEQGDDNEFTSAPIEEKGSIGKYISEGLSMSFLGAKQIVFAPIWDALHSRTTAICFGWVTDVTRIYRPESDVVALSSFCMAAMSHIQRLETQRSDQVKSDFLGSISHETRSPLHNVLGNLELLLGTDCNDEQREMLVNARFGATQLLETIDKILLFSRVSSKPTVVVGQAANESGIADAGKVELDQDKDQDRGDILQIGEKPGKASTASGNSDLIGLCEEIVEDVATRMRLSDTLIPSESRRDMMQGADQKKPQSDSEKGATGDGHFSIVLFDARSSDNCQVSSNSGLRIILENLLSNAIKFTRIDCCVRCCLTVNSDFVEISVIDCGRGFTPDFVRHSLYIPFSQQDSIDNGLGLGMSLVKQYAESLQAAIQIDTEPTLGTTVAVSLPIQRLTHGIEQKPQNDPRGRGGTAFIPPMPDRPDNELPVLKACVYVPSQWMRRYDKRDERSIDLLHQSLGHTFGAWFQPVISIWQQSDNEGEQDLPELVFVTQGDVEAFQQASGEKFKNVKTVVICADIGKNSESDGRKLKAAASIADAIITGSVIPSKLWKTVTTFFPHIAPSDEASIEKTFHDLDIEDQGTSMRDRMQSPRNNDEGLTLAPTSDRPSDHAETDNTSPSPSRDSTNTPQGGAQYVNDTRSSSKSPRQRLHSPDQPESNESRNNSGRSKSHIRDGEGDEPAHSKEHSPSPQHEQPARSQISLTRQRNVSVPPQSKVARPRILLVDDNPINLKMLGMFVKKSGIPNADFESVTGGQEAIDAFREAFQSDDEPGFDVVFMDLSMPEVSGFDAVAAIRRIENANVGRKAQIAALTGLVSEKDRSAAVAVGVDHYVTKPAGLKNVQAVIEQWTAGFEKSG